MKDKETVMGKDPILDSRGLMCDMQQLRYVVHELACVLGGLLQSSPVFLLALGEEDYTRFLSMAISAHAVSCEEDKAELPAREDPTYRLFHTDD